MREIGYSSAYLKRMSCAWVEPSSSTSSSQPLPPSVPPLHAPHSFDDPTVRMELERHPFSVIEHEGNYSGIGFAMNDEVRRGGGREGGNEGWREEGDHKIPILILSPPLLHFLFPQTVTPEEVGAHVLLRLLDMTADYLGHRQVGREGGSESEQDVKGVEMTIDG